MSQLPVKITSCVAGDGIWTQRLGISNVLIKTASAKLPGIMNDMNLLYYPSLLLHWLRFRTQRLSLVHHHVFTFRGTNCFDILASLELLGDIPLIIGDAEPPHTFDLGDYKLYGGKGKANPRVEHMFLRGVSNLATPLLTKGFLATLDRCSKLVAVNSATKQIYARHLSLKKIVVIPEGIAFDSFVRGNVDTNEPVLMVGNLIQRKGFHIGIHAIAEVRKTFPNVRLEIVGDGPERLNLMKLIKELHLESCVTLTGRLTQKELLKKYSSCSLFCHPSLSEGYSQTILEAMASGRPIVCTNIAGSANMVEDGANGYIVSSGDSSMLAKAMIQVLSDAQLAEKMGARSSEKAKRYDWRKIAKEYFDLYLSVAN